MSTELSAIKRGYAYVEINERGRFLSEASTTFWGCRDYDWMSKEPWSSGKVGLIGCSSTAEWQINVASRGNPSAITLSVVEH